jgi:SAM-dependent methyltransferase
MQTDIGALIDAASRPYLAAGRYAYHFARNKLMHDPVFVALLRSGRISDRARVLDLGCGQAVLASLLLAAHERFRSGLWPAQWAAPPSGLQLHGIESEERLARRARVTLGNRATVHIADLHDAPLPEADIVVMIDVLHYLNTDAQVAVLERVAASLRGGGLLMLRVANPEAGWKFQAGKAADRFGSLLSARTLPKHHHRRTGDWLRLLGGLGFDAGIDASGAAASFANVLLWARPRPMSGAR